MTTPRLFVRSSRLRSTVSLGVRCRQASQAGNPFQRRSYADERAHPQTEEWRATQKARELNPKVTIKTSTVMDNVPKVGVENAPPELLSSVTDSPQPTDSAAGNTAEVTGKFQQKRRREWGNAERNVLDADQKDLGVGELEGAKFKVEPLRRTGEDIKTMRARLLCLSLAPVLPILALVFPVGTSVQCNPTLTKSSSRPFSY